MHYVSTLNQACLLGFLLTRCGLVLNAAASQGARWSPEVTLWSPKILPRQFEFASEFDLNLALRFASKALRRAQPEKTQNTRKTKTRENTRREKINTRICH